MNANEPESAVLGLDIGGANIKIAHENGFTQSISFPLWQRHGELRPTLAKLIAAAPPATLIAATMTGELADCYNSKSEGVADIVDALIDAAQGTSIAIYSTSGKFVSPDEAKNNPLSVAASNWHALASQAGRYAGDKSAILIDIGSTTTDIIPIVDGRPNTIGFTDPDRLASNELVYTGAIRTPLFAILRQAPYRNGACRLAAELFATMVDVYVWLGMLPESEVTDAPTADGRPATRECARHRLARAICADATMLSDDEIMRIATAARDQQIFLITCAVRCILARQASQPAIIFLSGIGDFIAKEVIRQVFVLPRKPKWPRNTDVLIDPIIPPYKPPYTPPRVIQLSKLWGREASDGAPAFAIAKLGREWIEATQVGEDSRNHSSFEITPLAPKRQVPTRVIKVGGSLLDRADLVERLIAWINSQPEAATILVCGGGRLVEAIRHADAAFQFPTEVSDALALDAMQLSTEIMQKAFLQFNERSQYGESIQLCLLNSLVEFQGELRETPSPNFRQQFWLMQNRLLQYDEPNAPGPSLEAGWHVTSDSIAARVAIMTNADELVLLKSCEVPTGATAESLAKSGIVDEFFLELAPDLRSWRAVKLESSLDHSR